MAIKMLPIAVLKDPDPGGKVREFVSKVCEPIGEIMLEQFENASDEEEHTAVMGVVMPCSMFAIEHGQQDKEVWLAMCARAYELGEMKLAAEECNGEFH
jgi:hypothetical protein